MARCVFAAPGFRYPSFSTIWPAAETTETILNEYPTLKPEHFPAAIAFAAELARERIVPIPV